MPSRACECLALHGVTGWPPGVFRDERQARTETKASNGSCVAHLTQPRPTEKDLVLSFFIPLLVC